MKLTKRIAALVLAAIMLACTLSAVSAAYDNTGAPADKAYLVYDKNQKYIESDNDLQGWNAGAAKKAYTYLQSNPGATAYIVQQKDLEVVKQNVLKSGQMTLSTFHGSVVYDMNGKKVTFNNASHAYALLDIQFRDPDNYEGHTSLTVKNGSISVLKNKHDSAISFEGFKTPPEKKTFSLNVENVAFSFGEGAKLITFHAKNVKPAAADVIFTDATFDLTKADNNFLVFNGSSEAINLKYVVAGGEIVVAAGKTVDIANLAAGSSLVMKPGKDGKYLKITVKGANAALPTTDTSFVNEAGETLSFVKVSSDANTTVYELKSAKAAETTKAPAVTKPSAGAAGSAPQTFDPAVIIAVTAAVSAAGFAVSKKKR